MKKIILVLLLLASTNLFAAFETFEHQGKVYMSTDDEGYEASLIVGKDISDWFLGNFIIIASNGESFVKEGDTQDFTVFFNGNDMYVEETVSNVAYDEPLLIINGNIIEIIKASDSIEIEIYDRDENNWFFTFDTRGYNKLVKQLK